jgi:hypothetical protein
MLSRLVVCPLSSVPSLICIHFFLFVGHVFATALNFFYVNSCVVVVLFIKLA